MIARLIRMRPLRGIGAAAALAIALAIGVSAAPGVARAACAAGSPSLSPDAFSGTVVRLGADHRQAFVAKDDGTEVEVDGGKLGAGVSSGDEVVFVLGGRYQIQPENSRPPFVVNDCTTTLLSVAALSPTPPTSASVATSASPSSALPSPIRSLVASADLTTYPTSSAHPDFVTGVVFVVLSALLLAVAFAVRALRRRLHR